MITTGVRDLLGNLGGVTLLNEAGAAVDGLRPAAIAQPADTGALSRLLKAAHSHGLRSLARGGGTQLHVGNALSGLDAVIDLSALTGVVEYRPRDLTITVQAGTTIAEVQQVLAGEGQMLGLDPPLPEQATVGGTLAANAFGPRRFRYGTARDFVIGIGAMLADGTAIKSGGRVVKNVAGYDFAKLLIGSWGTLATITSVTFRVYPRPAATGVVVAAFEDLGQAHRAAMAIAGSTLLPLSLDLVSPGALPGAPHAARGWLLVSEAGGSPATLARTRDELAHLCRAHGAASVTVAAGEETATLLAGVRDFGYRAGSGTLTLRVTARPSRTADIWNALARRPEIRDIEPTGVIRAGNGVIWCRLGGEYPEEAALINDLRSAIRPFDATVIVERCRPETKATIDVWGITGSDLAIMQRVKAQFDANGVLSPGRGPGKT